jgi:retron-type reverse transcriptase
LKSYRNALHEICSPEFLEVVWNGFYNQTPKRKRVTSGADRVNFYDFNETKKAQFVEIRRQLLAPDTTYKTYPLNVFAHEKPNRPGEYRIICIPSIKDRLIQKALLQYYASKNIKLDSKISFGTGGNRTVKRALNLSKKLRSRLPYVYKTDITSFFDQIPRAEISKLIKSKIRHKSLHPILLAAINSEIKSSIDSDTRSIIRTEGITAGKGLRQGLPLSPLLSNLYLRDFDNQLVEAGVKVIRYADDMIIFCANLDECIAAHELCKSLLDQLGLSIPDIAKDSKSQIYKPEHEAEFLGLGIYLTNGEYQIRITKKQIDKVWKKFEAFSDINENISKELTFATLVSRLDSMITSYGAHYDEAENFAQFEDNLAKWKSKIIKDILLSNYNIELAKLTKNQRIFLHLQ